MSEGAQIESGCQEGEYAYEPLCSHSGWQSEHVSRTAVQYSNGISQDRTETSPIYGLSLAKALNVASALPL